MYRLYIFACRLKTFACRLEALVSNLSVLPIGWTLLSLGWRPLLVDGLCYWVAYTDRYAGGCFLFIWWLCFVGWMQGHCLKVGDLGL